MALKQSSWCILDAFIHALVVRSVCEFQYAVKVHKQFIIAHIAVDAAASQEIDIHLPYKYIRLTLLSN